jgi:5-methyltetrahydropteroyltriglutamate--homocysteine methyltransferase
MKTSIIGYPRIGKRRELKKAIESYFAGDLTAAQLEAAARALRVESWKTQQRAGITHIPSNDFSLYDNTLDVAALFGLIPAEYRATGLSPLDTYFAMARGHQDSNGVDIKALPMKKWFNTNYHYIVPTLEDDMAPRLSGEKPIDEFKEALQAGILTRPTIIGPFTFLKLAHFSGIKGALDFSVSLADAYIDVLKALRQAGAMGIQFEEPSLATDREPADAELFSGLYARILGNRDNLKVTLAIPFGDVRDSYSEIMALDFDGVSLDFIEGKKNLELIHQYGFPLGKTLVAGIINGKNVWRSDQASAFALLGAISEASGCDARNGRLEIGTSCSLLHVPVSAAEEREIAAGLRSRLAFAEEKLAEIVDLGRHLDAGVAPEPYGGSACGVNASVQERLSRLTAGDFTRRPGRKERVTIQQEKLKLPALPTTTIGSFPQTEEVRELRAQLKKGNLETKEYESAIRRMVAECVRHQEEIGLDVLVHGEFERNDMVEFFGQRLNGFIFTKNGWVQSYGTRCVKPPIIVSDVSREGPITVELAQYAQSLTQKPVKGMLTGPVTILNWSFPREDIPLGTSVYQIALAIRDEVLDLERNGIGIIQIDEAALREKMPLRQADRAAYFDWAIPAFRLTHSGVKPETQIHTHMCYSDFTTIVREIDAMDADVISFEASRSKLELLDFLAAADFQTAVGAGVYDIHSPRVPSQEEIEAAIGKTLDKLGRKAVDYDRVWVNPDCGLKTRDNAEVWPSLTNLVRAAKRARNAHSR